MRTCSGGSHFLLTMTLLNRPDTLLGILKCAACAQLFCLWLRAPTPVGAAVTPCSSASAGADHDRGPAASYPARGARAGRRDFSATSWTSPTAQIDRGHHVGIIADSITGGERAAAALAEIAPRLKLGVHRVAIRREPRSDRLHGVGAIRAA
mgnify:CR=1 FL=1